MLKKWVTMGVSVVMAAVLFTAPVYAHGHGHHSDTHHTRTEISCGVGADRGIWANSSSNAGTGAGTNSSADTGAGAGTNSSASTAAGTGTGCWMNQNGEIVPGCPVHAGGAAEGSCLVCGVDGCTQTGHHLHENAVYCGYPHAGGYCDGTCIVKEGN